MRLRQHLKNNLIAKSAYAFYRLLTSDFRFSNIKNIFWFFHDYVALKEMQNKNFENISFYPCLNDKLTYTPLEPTYFFQDTWVAAKIFRNKPQHHYDVGSSVMSMGILSQFVPITLIDIRRIDLKLPQLHYLEGSILSIPFESNSISSLSSLCVVEHIGLGRYGDSVDAFGSEKAAKELQRVLAKNGNLYFSVPVDCECRIYFNAHRAFTRDYILKIFADLTLIEEKYQYGRELYDVYDSKKGFGTGLFYFRKTN